MGELVNAAQAFVEATDGGTLAAASWSRPPSWPTPTRVQDDEGVVRLMTIHTAKGLEFPVVILAGCEEELLPHANSAVDERGLEEERRLFYVALTRARRRVHLLQARAPPPLRRPRGLPPVALPRRDPRRRLHPSRAEPRLAAAHRADVVRHVAPSGPDVELAAEQIPAHARSAPETVIPSVASDV